MVTTLADKLSLGISTSETYTVALSADSSTPLPLGSSDVTLHVNGQTFAPIPLSSLQKEFFHFPVPDSDEAVLSIKGYSDYKGRRIMISSSIEIENRLPFPIWFELGVDSAKETMMFTRGYASSGETYQVLHVPHFARRLQTGTSVVVKIGSNSIESSNTIPLYSAAASDDNEQRVFLLKRYVEDVSQEKTNVLATRIQSPSGAWRLRVSASHWIINCMPIPLSLVTTRDKIAVHLSARTKDGPPSEYSMSPLSEEVLRSVLRLSTGDETLYSPSASFR